MNHTDRHWVEKIGIAEHGFTFTILFHEICFDIKIDFATMIYRLISLKPIRNQLNNQ